MGIERGMEPGEQLAAALRKELRRLRIDSIRAQYVAERNAISLSWPHATAAGAWEGVGFPASQEWAVRVRKALRAHARKSAA